MDITIDTGYFDDSTHELDEGHVGKADSYTRHLDIPEETARRWLKVQKDYRDMQDEIDAFLKANNLT